MTSSGLFFKNFLEKIASKASGVAMGGTVVVTEIGRWMEKKDATCTSGETEVSYKEPDAKRAKHRETC